MSQRRDPGGRAVEAVAATTAAPTPTVAPGKRTRVQSSRGARLAVTPGTLSMNARVGSSQTQAVTLTNRSREPVEIVDIIPQARPPAFGSPQIESTRLEPGAATRAHVEFRPLARQRHVDTLIVETGEGPDTGIRVFGHGHPARADAIAAGNASAAREAEDDARGQRQARARRDAHAGEAPLLFTYAQLEAAFSQAVDFGAREMYPEATVLATAVAARMGQLCHPQHVGAVLDRLGVGRHAASMVLAQARDAADGVARRAVTGWTITREPALATFQQARPVLVLLTGESADAGMLRAFDDHTLALGAVTALPAVVAGLPLVASELPVLAPLLWQEVQLLAAASSSLFATVTTWIAAHPEEAEAWAEVAIGLGLDAAEDPERFYGDLQSVDGWFRIATDLFFTVYPARSGGHGGGRDEDTAPSRPRPPRAAPAVGDEPGLPPVAHRQASAGPAGQRARIARATEDTLDRLRAFVAAVRTRSSEVMVPRARSSAARDGVDPPLTRADDATPVPDRGTTLGERYDHELHGRQVGRAAARGTLHDGGLGESALATRNLTGRGGRVVERRDDPLLGDVLVTVELPNRQRVTGWPSATGGWPRCSRRRWRSTSTAASTW